MSELVPETTLKFRRLPGMFANYVRVVASRKPMIAPTGTKMGLTFVSADAVPINKAHLDRYRDICGIPAADHLPHAYVHALAMPLHMFIFSSPSFPVKVLGLIHLRNTIRCYRPI